MEICTEIDFFPVPRHSFKILLGDTQFRPAKLSIETGRDIAMLVVVTQ